ncbi:MAG: outer membrane lipoprotein-sorting protein [Gammaproteobacteria bacterium]|nr:outer membrane lipoprotein-sorting protein [Gammaproteobacteria bacterium]
MNRIILSLLFLLPSSAFSADLTDVDHIVDRAIKAAFYAGEDGRAVTRMTIVDKQGRKQLRQFTILRHDVEDGGKQKFLVYFTRPSDVKKTMFLVHKHPGKTDDRWLYLPELDLVKRIAAGDDRTSFVGSNFFYEDVSGRDSSADTHELIQTSDTFYVVKNTPKDPSSVEFSQYTVWIDKDTFIPMKTEYKDEDGTLYRRVETMEVKEISGFNTATKMKVSNLRNNSYTLNEMRFIKYNLGIPESIFAERSLRSPPIKWLKNR